MSEAKGNSTPAAGAAAPPSAGGDPAAPNTEGEAPTSGVEPRSRQVRVTVANGVKTVTIIKPVAVPKGGTPAPAAGASSSQDTAGKAGESVPAKDGKPSTIVPPGQKTSPGQPASSSASDKKDAPTTEPGKKPESAAEKPPLSKAYAALLDREAKITADQGQLKADRAALEADRSAWTKAKELGKTSKLEAIKEAFGWTIDDLQNEYLGSLEGTLTPQQIAERAAIKKFEELQKANTDRQAEEQRTRDEENQRQQWAKVEDCTGKLNAAFAELAGELDAVQAAIDQAAKGVGLGVTPLMIINWWAKSHGGEFPTDPQATLRAYEAELRGSWAARGYAKAPAAPAVEKVPEPEKKTAPTVRVKASPTPTITSEDAGDVPIRANRKESATERAARIVRERISAN